MYLRDIGMSGVDWICVSGHGPVAGCFERTNELSSSMKVGELLDKLNVLHSFSVIALLHGYS
jgi:hypothetical protein